MRVPRKSRGGAAGGLIRLLVVVVLGFMLISKLPGCAQQLGQMAGNTATRAASGAAGGTGSALSQLGHELIDYLESWWGGLSPAEKFDKLCENVPVEGVDKLCPYFTAALKGASEMDAAQTACYTAAVGTVAGGGQQTLDLIQKFCRQSDPSGFASCLRGYVQEAGGGASCLGSSPEQFWLAARTMIEPIACPPGVPKSLCTTQPASQSSSASTSAPNTSAPDTTAPNTSSTRTDQSYLNCLTYYYQFLRPWGQTSCGSTITAGSADCARTALLNFTYQGQSVGAGQVAQCDGLPP